ncbi:MAG: RND transporter, partial [Chloroflexus aggregans]
MEWLAKRVVTGGLVIGLVASISGCSIGSLVGVPTPEPWTLPTPEPTATMALVEPTATPPTQRTVTVTI